MPTLRDRQFNLINILYGSGAVIVLLAALTTLWDWRFSRELFAFGIIIEIVVFIVSMIDSQISAEEMSQSTVVNADAPLITSKPKEESQKEEEPSVKTNNQQVLSSISALNSSVSELYHSTQKLSEIVMKMEKNHREVLALTKAFKLDIDKLRDQMNETNQKIKSLEEVKTP